MQDKLKQSKKKKFIAKWTKANHKNENKPKLITKMYNKIQNETKQIKRKINFLHDRLEQFKKKTAYWKKD